MSQGSLNHLAPSHVVGQRIADLNLETGPAIGQSLLTQLGIKVGDEVIKKTLLHIACIKATHPSDSVVIVA